MKEWFSLRRLAFTVPFTIFLSQWLLPKLLLVVVKATELTPNSTTPVGSAHPHAEFWLWIVFAGFVIGFLVFDLGFMNRKDHEVTTKSASLQTIFWIVAASIFGGLVWYFMGAEPSAQFFSAYVNEKMLSADNLMVIMMLFIFFDIKQMYQHRVLYWGILGAVVFRAIFIGAGAVIVGMAHPVLYIFGAFLIYVGFKTMFVEDDEEEQDFEKQRSLQFLRRVLPLSAQPHGGHFFIKEGGKEKVTLLFLVLCMVEVTDLIFAVDSIPAGFAITTNFFILFTSNIFAVMGLRALFFVVEKVLSKFPHLSKGIGFVLVFIGAKMFLDLIDPAIGYLAPVFGFAHTPGQYNFHLTSLQSFGVIIASLSAAMIYSVVAVKLGWVEADPKHEAKIDDSDETGNGDATATANEA